MARFIILSLLICQLVEPYFPHLQELNLPFTLTEELKAFHLESPQQANCWKLQESCYVQHSLPQSAVCATAATYNRENCIFCDTEMSNNTDFS